MRICIVLAIGFVLVSSTGCAKLLRGDSQTIKFTSDPSGALVRINDTIELTTPGEARLARKDKHSVVVSKPGYRAVKFDMTAQWDGASLGNVIMPGGSVGFATDTATGADRAFYKLEKIKLEPTTDTNAPPLELIQYRGKLYDEEGYKQALEEEREYREWYLH